MRETWKHDNIEYQAMAMAHDVRAEEKFMGDDWLDSLTAMTILDTKYEKVDIQEVATAQKHLEEFQQRALV